MHEVSILAINDVYELDPTAGRGGLSRFATYAKELYSRNPSGMIVALPGDFYSPSALGFAPVKDADGKPNPLRGKQMVDMFNYISEITNYPGDTEPALIATYGNHEFDLNEAMFHARVNESKFPYISSNVFSTTQELANTSKFLFMTKNGITFAILGVSTNMAQPSYISIHDRKKSIDGLREIVNSFKAEKRKYDVLIALTHWNLEDDVVLAGAMPEIDLIMGGHEHENWYIDRGNAQHPVIIAKADSNAKTVFYHKLRFDRTKADKVKKDAEAAQAGAGEDYDYGTASKTGAFTIESVLKSLDSTVKNDPVLDTRIATWTKMGYDAYRASNIDPSKPMALLTTDFPVLDKIVRHEQSFVTSFCADALMKATRMVGEQGEDSLAPGLFNSGSLRIDDVLAKGPIREYDALRMWAFGGEVLRVRMTGKYLTLVLNRGQDLRGSGDYLSYNTEIFSQTSTGNWLMYGKPLDENTLYDVSILEYMYSGTDKYFTPEEKQVEVEVIALPDGPADCQHALIEHFERVYPIPANILLSIPEYDEERITPFPRFKF